MFSGWEKLFVSMVLTDCATLFVQAIEKRSPRQSPVTESQGHGPSIKAVAKEVASERAADRSDSPPQRGVLSKEATPELKNKQREKCVEIFNSSV